MLYKRGSKWWVRFTARGREIRVTSGTDRRELAEEFEQRLREAIWREKALGQEIHTWEEACERWLKEKAHKRSIKRDRQAIAALGLQGGTLLDEIRQSNVADRGNRSRALAVLRSILHACTRWGWLDKAPRIQISAPKKQDPRWITQEQFEALCDQLPPHAERIARFAVATGLRASNIFRLRWDDIDLKAKRLTVSARASKSGVALGSPLSEAALQAIRRAGRVHHEFVFTDHKGRAPIRSIKTAWNKATQRAGLEGFRFHDLRHTWAAWHTLSGTPPIILKELGGWSSLSLVERYAHLGAGHLAEWAGNARPYRKRHSGALMRPRRKK